jgi:hypothetical protein
MGLHQSIEWKVLDYNLRELQREHQEEIDSLWRGLVLSQFVGHVLK